MKRLYIQFQDGSHFWGTYNLYGGGLYDRGEDVKSQPSYKCGDVRCLLYYWDKVILIQPEDSKFLYPITSILKMCDLSLGEFTSLNRISKVEKLEV